MGTFIVTGANRGIGLELCRQLQARGETVIAACRRSSPGLEALSVRVETDVDVSSDKRVQALSKNLEGTNVDVLINCAGILEYNTLDKLDFDSMREQFEINSLGPLRMTAAIVPLMTSGAKIAMVTSRMGSIADNDSGGAYGYRMSKCALNSAAASLAIDLKPAGIAVGLLHPGYVRTEMTGGNGLIDPPESATGLLARVDELTMENTGSFWHMNGEILPW